MPHSLSKLPSSCACGSSTTFHLHNKYLFPSKYFFTSVDSISVPSTYIQIVAYYCWQATTTKELQASRYRYMGSHTLHIWLQMPSNYKWVLFHQDKIRWWCRPGPWLGPHPYWDDPQAHCAQKVIRFHKPADPVTQAEPNLLSATSNAPTFNYPKGGETCRGYDNHTS